MINVIDPSYIQAFSEHLQSALQDSIEKFARKKAEKLLKEYTDIIGAEMKRLATEAALYVSNQVSVRAYERELIITIKIPEKA